MQTARDLFSYRKHWAHRYGVAPVLPTTRAEMAELGWDRRDVVIVTGDAYIDHPSFGMAIIGRLLEAAGIRVGILEQPDWHRRGMRSPKLGRARPDVRHDRRQHGLDGEPLHLRPAHPQRRRLHPARRRGRAPTRSVIVYSQRVREAYKDVPVVVGGIEASLRRIAHFDYWSEKVRRSVLLDAKADLLVYGNAERQIGEIAHRLAAGTPIDEIRDLRGTAFVRKATPEGWTEIDSTHARHARTARARRSIRTPMEPSAGAGKGGSDQAAADRGNPLPLTRRRRRRSGSHPEGRARHGRRARSLQGWIHGVLPDRSGTSGDVARGPERS